MVEKIIIDAGHGGANPGATYEGRRESDDALLLAMAALVALCYAMGLGGHDSALVVLALIFEAIGLGCWWISAGSSR